MKRGVLHILEIAAGFAVIGLVFGATKFAFDAVSLKFPPSIGGMLVLFALMCAHLVPMKPLTAACRLLLDHMQMFFAPILVSLLLGDKLPRSQLWILIALLIASTFATFAITAWGIEIFRRRKLSGGKVGEREGSASNGNR